MRRLLVALLALVPAAVVHAHSFDPALLDVTEGGEGQYAIVWKRAPGPAALLPRLPAHCRILGTPPEAVTSTAEPQRWRVDCGARGLRGAALDVDGLDVRIDVVVRVAWRDGRTTSGVLRADAGPLVLPDGPAGDGGAIASGYVRLGIEHILLGADHLLFVLGLLLLVRGFGALVRTITAFTVAHSASLALAVLDVVRLPPAPVEATIALSIVAVALEALRDPQATPTLMRRAPWAAAFGFGLLHGLGFASALASVGLPPGHVPLALFSFNVGVELGQLAFVAVAWPLVAALRAVAVARPWLGRVPAYAIGSMAVAWTLDRIVAFWAPTT